MVKVAKAKLAGYAMLFILLASCGSIPKMKRDVVNQKDVEGNVIGPFSYDKVRSPTEIDVIEKKNGSVRRITLKLRGTKNFSDHNHSESAIKNLHRSLYNNRKGLYVIKDTATFPSEDRICGVVLKGIQGSASHDLDTGETTYSMLLYQVMQSEGLLLGQIQIDEEDLGFGWDQDFKYFQEKGRKELNGFWLNNSLEYTDTNPRRKRL